MNEKISKKGLTIFKKAYWHGNINCIKEYSGITSTILQNRRNFKLKYNLKTYVGNDEKIKALKEELRKIYGDAIDHFEAYSNKNNKNTLLVVSPCCTEANFKLISDGWFAIEPIYTTKAVTHVKWYDQSKKKEKKKRSRDESEDEEDDVNKEDQDEPSTKKRTGNASVSSKTGTAQAATFF